MIALVLILAVAQADQAEQDAAAVLSAAAQRERAAEIAKERAMAEQLAGREATLLGQLAAAERDVDVETRALRAAQAKLHTAELRVAAAERKAREADSVARAALDRAAPRLVARYRLGREGYLRFLLGAQSIADLVRRQRLFDALLAADLDVLTQLRAHSEAAKDARNKLAAVRDDVARTTADEAQKRATLEARALAQRRLLASAQDDRVAHEQALRELEEAEHALTSEVRALQERPAAPSSAEGPIAKLRGKLLFPVESGTVETRFGRAVDERWSTVTLHRGIDVRCDAGTQVRAVHAGRVVHSGWFHGYGNLMIVDHGDGYFSLMAHLGTLARATGDEVRRGDVVGTVGDSGSLKGAYLYFELRQGQTPLDPELWLARPPRRPTSVAGPQASAPVTRGP
ncbi:MAG TPA: peptidoglycan DD-metalloendopeptidase family protein [Myxococcales bacterium]|jgi:septal ring factor EnvC (AmiA/AmiB activator)|nr:peptidoglycan DD-metalloendopeptidase family protein [Myxococcales bacterium]